MSAPLDASMLRALIREQASRVDRELEQEDGQTLRELCTVPLIAASYTELMNLWRQLQDSSSIIEDLP